MVLRIMTTRSAIETLMKEHQGRFSSELGIGGDREEKTKAAGIADALSREEETWRTVRF